MNSRGVYKVQLKRHSNLLQVQIKKEGGVNDKSRYLAYTDEWVLCGGLFGYGETAKVKNMF